MGYTKGKWEVTDTAFTRYTLYYGKKSGARTFITDGINLSEVAEVQGDTDTEAEANAKLIVSAVNACIAINPENPQAVADSIGDMYEAVRYARTLVGSQKALAKAEGRDL